MSDGKTPLDKFGEFVKEILTVRKEALKADLLDSNPKPKPKPKPKPVGKRQEAVRD